MSIKDFGDRWILLFALLALLFYALVFAFKFDGLSSPDQMHYAQVARHLYHGHGFITSRIDPLSLASHSSLDNHPDFLSAPLYPLFIAAFFYIFGVNDAAAIFVSGFFYVLLVPLVYLFARDLFGRKAGLWAGMMTLTSVVLVLYSMRGLTEMMFTFLFVLSLYLLYKRVNPLLLGLLVALSYLTHYNALVFLPGFLWFIYKKYPRWKTDSLKFIAAFAITASPWWIRNFALWGDPFFTLQRYQIVMSTDIIPGNSLFRTFTPVEPLGFIFSHPISMIKKALIIATKLFVGVPALTVNFFVPALALAGLLRIVTLRKHRPIFVPIIMMFSLQVLALLLYDPVLRFFVNFVPVFILLAGYEVVNILEVQEEKKVRKVLMALFALLLVLANVGGIIRIDTSQASYVLKEEIDYIKAEAGGEEAVVTDVPWMIAWYSERTAIWFPETYDSMKEHLPGANYVYFGSRVKKEGVYKETIYKEYLENPLFQRDFELIQEFDSGAVLFQRKKIPD